MLQQPFQGHCIMAWAVQLSGLGNKQFLCLYYDEIYNLKIYQPFFIFLLLSQFRSLLFYSLVSHDFHSTFSFTFSWDLLNLIICTRNIPVASDFIFSFYLAESVSSDVLFDRVFSIQHLVLLRILTPVFLSLCFSVLWLFV